MQKHAAARRSAAAPMPAAAPATPRTLIALEFDTAYYLENNEDVRFSGMDPFEHFLLHGAAELRNPNPWFDTGFYVRNNADVVDAEVNPFWHYLAHGKAEGREPAARRQAERATLAQAVPPTARWAGSAPDDASLHGVDALRSIVAGQLGLPGVRLWRRPGRAPGAGRPPVRRHPVPCRGAVAGCARGLERRRAPAACVGPGARIRPGPPLRYPPRPDRREPARHARQPGPHRLCRLHHGEQRLGRLCADRTQPCRPGRLSTVPFHRGARRPAAARRRDRPDQSDPHHTPGDDGRAGRGLDRPLLVLSPWPETFCLVAYEAVAAGADVITLPESGNVADMVLALGRGLVIPDTAGIVEFFASGAPIDYVRMCGEQGSEMGRLESRGMTATLALPGASPGVAARSAA